ncbi:nucleoside polyphosphate hydrolase [Pycnococcus provasolii]
MPPATSWILHAKSVRAKACSADARPSLCTQTHAHTRARAHAVAARRSRGLNQPPLQCVVPHASSSPSSAILTGEPGREWRRCVGVCIINSEGLVWGAQRVGEKKDFWQMPQGGMNRGEDSLEAAQRELYEETGIKKEHVELVTEYPTWLVYEYPNRMRLSKKKRRYKGQAQRWFLFRFKGTDDAVDLSGQNGQKAEFKTWKWMPMKRVREKVVEWKRDVYVEALGAFEEHL